MSDAHPIIEMEVDGEMQHFYADLKHRVLISVNDPREWYPEEHCNGTIAELIKLFRVTEH